VRKWALLAAIGLAGCGDSAGPAPMTPTATPAPTTPAPSATARYRVVFDATWSAATHPNMFPGNPHFSGLVGATHREGYRFWETGGVASNGMEAMAELGAKSPLDDEIAAAMALDRVEHFLSGGGISASPGSVSLEFDVSLDRAFVSLVSMLAPSPDWFVGVSATSLLEDGDWVDELVVELFVYDAGTDSGETFGSRNEDTVPRETIVRITTPPLSPGNGTDAPPVGTFTFRRLR